MTIIPIPDRIRGSISENVREVPVGMSRRRYGLPCPFWGVDRARDSGSGAREEATGSLDRPIEQDTLDMRRSIEHGEVVAWADATRLWTWGCRMASVSTVDSGC